MSREDGKLWCVSSSETHSRGSPGSGGDLDLPSCSSQGNLSDCSDYHCFSIYTGFPGGSDGKESACNARDLISVRVGKIPWILLPRSLGGGHGNPTPVFLPGESPGQRSLVGFSPRSHKERDTTERLNTAQYLHIREG